MSLNPFEGQLQRLARTLTERFGVDVLPLPRASLRIDPADPRWMPWTLPNGSLALVPSGFDPVQDERGDWLLRTGKDVVWRMPAGGLYFDLVYHPLADATTVAEIEAFELPDISDEELAWLRSEAQRLYKMTDKAIMGHFGGNILDSKDMVARAFAEGVTMGSDLSSREGGIPAFLVWAERDPLSAALQRVQIIKGWIDDGTPREKVYDVACSDGLKVDPLTHRCPDNGAKVNLADCSITADVGDAQMKTLWTDPEFDPEQSAFYYARVIEIPTPRWTAYEAKRFGITMNKEVPMTTQERAYTSPIWYAPKG